MSCRVATVHCRRVLCRTAIFSHFFQSLIKWKGKHRHWESKLVILFCRVPVKNNFMNLESHETIYYLKSPFSVMYKPVNKFAAQINWVIYIWLGSGFKLVKKNWPFETAIIYHKISPKISETQEVKIEIRLIKFFAFASLTKSSYI